MTVLILFLLGLAVGSFLGVLAERLPKGQDVLVTRSHCDFCKHKLTASELIPVVSWVIQGGRSACCHKKLSVRYPLLEICTALLFVLLYWTHGTNVIQLVGILIIFCSLVVMFFADWSTHIIPDSMIVSGLVGVVLFHWIDVSSITLIHLVLSGGGAGLFFFFLWLGTRGRGMGFGDVKLSFLLGVWLGFPRILITLYVAFLTGAGVGVILMMLRKKSLKSTIAFGPFLIFGSIVAFFWGDVVWQYIIKIF